MKRKLLIGVSAALIFLLGCRNSRVETAADASLVKSWEAEVQLKAGYESVEQDIKQNYGVRDQNKVDQMMQILIDEGELPVPYVLKRVGTGLKMEYLSYAAYKDYRARTPIDTTEIFIFHFDSLGNIIEKP